jgi:hypothetical protein
MGEERVRDFPNRIALPLTRKRAKGETNDAAALDAGDEFDRKLNRSRTEILKTRFKPMRYGCPNGHTDGIEQGCRLTVWLPVNPDTGETDTDTLDGRETDNWEHGYYYCPTCWVYPLIWGPR